MEKAAGLAHVPKEKRDPRITTTYGVGELLQHAYDAGARHYIVGIGGGAPDAGGAGPAPGPGAPPLPEKSPGPPPRGPGLQGVGRVPRGGGEADGEERGGGGRV